MLILLERAPALRQQMGESSYKLVSQFSCENFARKALLSAQSAMGNSLLIPDHADPSEEPGNFIGKLLP